MSRLKTDASHSGLGATLEQWKGENWLTIAFTSRFLNSHETKYSTNEFELLGVVWDTEHFKNYLNGTEFEILTDHKVLLSASNAKTMHSRLTRWVNRLLPFNFKIKHIPGKEMGFTDLLSRLPSRKALPTSHYDSEFVVATVKKIVDNLSVNIDCKKNNCTKNELYNPVDVNTISNLDCNSPMGGKKELTLRNHRSFCSNILNCVNETIGICNSNHSRSESCTSVCIPLNLSKFDLNYFYLSDKTYLFFLAQPLLSVNQSLNSEKLLEEFLTSVNSLKISLRAENKGILLNFNNDIMSDIHKKLLANYKGDLKLPDTPLSLTEHRSSKLIRLMTDEDKILKEVKKVVEEGRPLDRFGAYLKNFQRDIHVKEGL